MQGATYIAYLVPGDRGICSQSGEQFRCHRCASDLNLKFLGVRMNCIMLVMFVIFVKASGKVKNYYRLVFLLHVGYYIRM